MTLDPDDLPEDFDYRYVPLGQLKQLIETIRDRLETPTKSGICKAIPGMERYGLKLVAEIMDIRLPETLHNKPQYDPAAVAEAAAAYPTSRKAAQALGMGRTTFLSYCDRYQIQRPHERH